MSTDLDASFTEQYNNINTNLKKRFMRKPNITEATNAFNALAIQCEHSEQPTFAGHSYIGAAKCEASAGNFLGEAECYLAAARQFVAAEIKLSLLKCYSPDRENLEVIQHNEAAIGCYIQTMNKYPEDSPLRTSVLMELANNLVILNKRLEAISYFEQALDTLVGHSQLRLKCLCNILSLNVQCGRFDLALETADSICDSKIGIQENILSDVQIIRIMLALIVEPAEKKSASLEQLFSDILNDNDGLPFNTDLQLKLQSIIICCATKDVECLIEVSADIERFFTLEQKELLGTLVKSMERNL